MAYPIMGDPAVATLLTLIFLPALSVAWFRISPPADTRVPEQAPDPMPAVEGCGCRVMVRPEVQ